MTWCWYIEGGSFHGGFTTRADAVRAALDDESPRALVGTVVSGETAILRYIDAKDLAERIDDEMATDEAVRVLPGAQEALEAWARQFLDHPYHEVCMDGSDITADDVAAWEATRG